MEPTSPFYYDLDRLVERVLASWARAKEQSDDQQLFLESVALNLHGFYSGLERVFELRPPQVVTAGSIFGSAKA